MSLMDDLSRELGKRRLPAVHVGDTVEVHYNIKEGDKERVQVFAGTVLCFVSMPSLMILRATRRRTGFS